MSTYDVRRSLNRSPGGRPDSPLQTATEPMKTRSLNRSGRLTSRSASSSPLLSSSPGSPTGGGGSGVKPGDNGRKSKGRKVPQRSISVSPLNPSSVLPLRAHSMYSAIGALVDPTVRSASVSPLRGADLNSTTLPADYTRHTLSVSPSTRARSDSPLQMHSSLLNKSLSDLSQRQQQQQLLQRSLSVSPMLQRPESVTSQVLSTAGELTPEERSRTLSFLLSDARQLHQKLLAISLDAKLDPVTLPKPEPPPKDLWHKLLSQCYSSSFWSCGFFVRYSKC